MFHFNVILSILILFSSPCLLSPILFLCVSLCLYMYLYFHKIEILVYTQFCIFFFLLIALHKCFSLTSNTFKYTIANGCMTFHYVEVHIKLYLINLLLSNI